MKINSATLQSGILVKLKDNSWINKQRVAGRVVAETLSLLERLTKQETKLSLIELNRLAEEHIYNSGCTPTFKNYTGFPAGVCISVNKQLVHGIPTDYVLQDGDVVSYDLGATYEGAIADSALTMIYGQPKSQDHVRIIRACEDALMKGIEAVKIGAHLGVIGHAISKYAKFASYKVINNYGGHGIDWNTPHASPFVANKQDPNDGIRITSGLSIAIEPMLVPSDTHTEVGSDGWTVYTREIGCHVEHSIFVHEDRVEIMTSRETL